MGSGRRNADQERFECHITPCGSTWLPSVASREGRYRFNRVPHLHRGAGDGARSRDKSGDPVHDLAVEHRCAEVHVLAGEDGSLVGDRHRRDQATFDPGNVRDDHGPVPDWPVLVQMVRALPRKHEVAGLIHLVCLHGSQRAEPLDGRCHLHAAIAEAVGHRREVTAIAACGTVGSIWLHPGRSSCVSACGGATRAPSPEELHVRATPGSTEADNYARIASSSRGVGADH